MSIEILLEKWSQDSLTPEEMRRLLEQLDSEEGQAAFGQLWDQVWVQDPHEAVPQTLDMRLEQVRLQIKAQLAFAPARIVAPSWARPLRWTLAAAAVVVLLIAGGWLRDRWSGTAPGDTPATARLTETVSRGERSRRIELADGTLVWLNVDSRLAFPAAFADSAREVWLTGEARFDVAHDTLRPFRVHMGEMTTEVLGTEFYVSAYQAEPVEVTLLTGRVRVSDREGRQALLQPGQQVRADADAPTWVVRQIDTTLLGAWEEGLLAYADIPLGELEPRLERWYNVQIVFDDSASKRCRINGKPTHKSVWDLLESFQFIHGINYEVGATGEIHISGGDCR